MASLFGRIASEMEAAGIDGALGDGVRGLAEAASVIGDLIADPPTEVGDMVSAVQGLSLPQIEPVADLIAKVAALVEQIPGDPSALTGGLEAGFASLAGTVHEELLEPLSSATEGIGALHTLLAPGENEQPPASVFPTLAADSGALDAVTAALARVEQNIDILPKPLTVESFLRWILGILNDIPLELFPISEIPVLTPFQQRLETVLDWLELDGSQLAARLESTLLSLAAFIPRNIVGQVQKVASEVAALAPQVPTTELSAPVQAVEQGLRDLTTLVESGDLSGVGPLLGDLNLHIGDAELVLSGLAGGLLDGPTTVVSSALADLPEDLEQRLREVRRVLKPPGESGLDPEIPTIEDVWRQDEADALAATIRRQFEGFRELVDDIDLEALREPLSAVIGRIEATAGGLDDQLIELTTTVALLFDQVEQVVDEVDTAAVTEAITATIDDLGAAVTEKVNTPFVPLREALEGSVQELRAAAQSFSVAPILNALRDLIGRLDGVLADPAVIETLGQIQQVLSDAVTALEELGFQPVTDAVVGEIEDLAGALRKIDLSSLPAPVRAALRAALAALPSAFQPIIDDLTSRFDELIEAGPAALLGPLRQQPEQLAQRVRELAPEQLIGERLSAPYQQLIESLATFRPSALLTPVEVALGTLAERLQALDPARLLAPLEGLYEDLTEAFARLDPRRLTEPLAELTGAVVDPIAAAIPQDEIFDPIDAVLAKIEQLLAAGEGAQTLLIKLTDLFAGLGGAQAQVRALIGPVLDLVDQIPDPASLEPPFAAVGEALDSITGAPLLIALTTPIDALDARLGELSPGPLHRDLVRAYRDLRRSAVVALPPSPERDQVLAFLDDFDPLAAAFAGPFSALATWRSELGERQTALADFFPGWDTRHHGADGPFAEFRRQSVGTAELRELLSDAVGSSFSGPLELIFQVLERFTALAVEVTGGLGDLVSHVQDRLATLQLIPAAVGAIRDAMNAILDTLRGFDLSFLAEQAGGVFDRVHDKLSALDPELLRETVEVRFQQLVGRLSPRSLLPFAAIEGLDTTVGDLLDELRALDPGKLLVEVAQPEFETAVEPLLEVFFELGRMIEALLERLDRLAGELNQELARTGQAFAGMQQAIPA